MPTPIEDQNPFIFPLSYLFFIVIIYAFIYFTPPIRSFLSSIIYYLKYFYKFPPQRSIIEKHLTFFKKLSSSHKREFLIRVNNFISDLEFEGREGFEITPKVKALIGACAAQITFGQKQFRISKVNKIIVYPEAYNFSKTDTYHKGTFYSLGTMAISWDDFIKGFDDDNDKLNVGLHEFAHAFHINILHSDEHDPFLDDFMCKFENIAKNILENDFNDNHFLRDYAEENIYELFAVSIEHFFEQPVLFEKELPELYKCICYLLNQDPSKNSYRGIKRKFKEKKIKPSPNKPITKTVSLSMEPINLGLGMGFLFLLNFSMLNTKLQVHHTISNYINAITLIISFITSFQINYFYKNIIISHKPLYPFKRDEIIDKKNVLYLREGFFVNLHYLRIKKSVWGEYNVRQKILGYLSDKKYDTISELYE